MRSSEKTVASGGEHLVFAMPVVMIGGTAMYKQLGIIALGLGIALAACEKGPAEKAGERIDKAVDALSGKGPVEKAGKRVDRAVDELTKK